jgi:hypothetical protein
MSLLSSARRAFRTEGPSHDGHEHRSYRKIFSVFFMAMLTAAAVVAQPLAANATVYDNGSSADITLFCNPNTHSLNANFDLRAGPAYLNQRVAVKIGFADANKNNLSWPANFFYADAAGYQNLLHSPMNYVGTGTRTAAVEVWFQTLSGTWRGPYTEWMDVYEANASGAMYYNGKKCVT